MDIKAQRLAIVSCPDFLLHNRTVFGANVCHYAKKSVTSSLMKIIKFYAVINLEESVE